MKTLCAVAMLSSFSLAHAARLSCGFSGGRVINQTGTQVARTFAPRVLNNVANLSADVKRGELVLTSLMNPDLLRYGTMSCGAGQAMPGSDCFVLAPGRYPERQIMVHISQNLPRVLVMAQPTGTPGGATQLDSYRCR